MQGIYLIEGAKGELYYGSAVNVEKRWSQHNSALLKGNHRNARLQRLFNKYGISYFTFTVIELVEDGAILLDREQFYLDYAFAVLPDNQRLNLARYAEAPGRGKTHTEESKAKISVAMKGKPSSNKGKTMSEEQKAKIAASNKGKTVSEEAKAKMSASKKGKKFTEDHRNSLKLVWAKRKANK